MKSFEKISQSRLKSYLKLTQKKYRQNERKFLVEGVHLVDEALKSEWEVECLIVNEEESGRFGEWENGRVKEMVKEEGIPMYECSKKEFTELSDTVTPQGIVAVVKIKEYTSQDFWKKLPKHAIIVVLDDVADPGNVGTIIRTCDWFGVDGVLLSKNSVELYNPKVLRSTMGSIFHLPIITEIDLGDMIQGGRDLGFEVITTVPEDGEPLDKFSFPERSIIIIGNEAHGVSQIVRKHAHKSVTITKYGKAESLNAAISCGIILNAWRDKKMSN
ncbi:MAG: RNA methyltransferase [Bacteroidota bacterium]|nr:RNA methyltransferase [Bacteroidota bacterium]